MEVMEFDVPNSLHQVRYEGHAGTSDQIFYHTFLIEAGKLNFQ